jgi:hypothetical protein
MKRLIIACLLLSGCGETAPNYFKIAGGGLQFNLATSQASMIVVAQQTSPMPPNSTLEALFDLPGTNTRQSVSVPTSQGRLQYMLQSKALTGITLGGRYSVSVLLHDKDGKVLDQKETTYVSDQDQALLPNKPLVEGPALTPHLENLEPSKTAP